MLGVPIKGHVLYHHFAVEFNYNNLFYRMVYFFRLGQFASMCLVHGGVAIRILSSSVYSFLCGTNTCDIIADVN